jgi:type VI secretion system protein ImpK
MHRTSHGGAGTLQGIQRSLYELIRRIRPKAAELSPRWRGQKIVVQAARFQVPVWAVGAVAGVALFRLLPDASHAARLVGGSRRRRDRGGASDHRGVDPAAGLRAPAASAAAPPPPTRQGDRLRIALAPEIQAQKVSLQDAPGYVVVRIANLALFAPGSAT